MKRNTNTLNIALLSASLHLLAANVAHADAIEAALNSLQGWLSTVIGSALVVIGATIVGIRMAAGDEHAWEKGKGVLIGGLIVFLAKTLLTVIRGWTGN
jgi:type IV secretory pathway VirB2 component (pilin)